MYEIVRIINNNFVHVKNDQDVEFVFMGKGIGFSNKAGSAIEESSAEKIFSMNGTNELVANLFENIDLSYISIVEKIVVIAQNELDVKLSETLFLTLLDHISYSIQRASEGIVLKSPLHYEVLRLYPDEVKIARKMYLSLNENLKIQLPEEEIVMIALHVVNAQNDTNRMKDTILSTAITKEIIDIIRYHYKKDYDEGEFHFNRFLVHLRYFVARHQDGMPMQEKQSTMYTIAGQSYPKSLACVELICDYLETEYHWDINNDERLYLLMHIEKFAN